MQQLSIRAFSPYLFCFLLTAICACSDDDSDNGVGPDDEIPTDLTDPDAVIESHGKALTQKDHAAYAALLDGDFEFIPLERDAHDFPWLQGDSWAKAEELDIIGNMFNPEFDGEQSPVNTIEAALTVLSQQTLPTGRIELTTQMQGEVLTTANHGWSFDTRVVFELVSREGFLRIVKIKEVDAVAGRGVEAASWASIKALYRAPISTNLTDPAAVIETHGRALRERDYDAYAALLDQDFEFYPREKDAVNMPWLAGDSWPLTDELSLIAHMFDPAFDGLEIPVDLIDISFTILSQQPLPTGGVQVSTTMDGRVLTAANDGWSFDTMAIFELVSREGYLRIIKITEQDSYLAGARSIGESSWGSIKGLYK